MRNVSYRNELYDRTSGYDVPRQLTRNNAGYGVNMNGLRRPNLNLDLNPNRSRYAAANRTHRQHSFDDTESYHYANNNGYRCENIYEQIHDEPVYRNVNINSRGTTTRHYGRLDVIGHGIGRIERHLSSSCGNIDHYNLGGHYAVLGHSHLGTVGHIRLNAGTAPSNTRESGGKSLNFFSCLGRENSQSMNNIYRATAAPSNHDGAASTTANSTSETMAPRPTGAIPKTKNKVAPKSASPPPVHSTTFNRIPKSSLQWLLVNKWLPLWVGQGPEYNVMDFNFMFSRNCETCGNESMADQQGLMHFNNNHNENPRFEYDYNAHVENSLRALRASQAKPCSRARFTRNPLLHERFRSFPGGGSEGDRAREIFERNIRRRYEFPGHSNRFAQTRSRATAMAADPFRHWELNSENNTFRPAQPVRRITDGTLPNHSGSQSQSPSVIRIEVTDSSVSQPPNLQMNQNSLTEPIASTSKCDDTKCIGTAQKTPRGSETDNERSSPESSNQRLNDTTEDDQSMANRISDNAFTDDDSDSIDGAQKSDVNTDDDDQSSFGPADD